MCICDNLKSLRFGVIVQIGKQHMVTQIMSLLYFIPPLLKVYLRSCFFVYTKLTVLNDIHLWIDWPLLKRMAKKIVMHLYAFSSVPY